MTVTKIMLEAVKDDNIANELADKILVKRPYLSLPQVLKMLFNGNVEYLAWNEGDDKEIFKSVTRELRELKVGYSLVKVEQSDEEPQNADIAKQSRTLTGIPAQQPKTTTSVPAQPSKTVTGIPAQQPRTTTSIPVQPSKTITDMPTQHSKTITDLLAQQPKTITSIPAQPSKTLTDVPAQQPKTITSMPTQQAKTITGLPAQQPRTTTSIPAQPSKTLTDMPAQHSKTITDLLAQKPRTTTSMPAQPSKTLTDMPALKTESAQYGLFDYENENADASEKTGKKKIIPPKIIAIFVVKALVITVILVRLNIIVDEIPTAREWHASGAGANYSRQGRQAERNRQFPRAGTQNNLQDAESDDALERAKNACGTASGVDIERMYRFAISFNRYNFKAWLGLLTCFERNQDPRKADQIRKEMRQVFGEDVFTIMRMIGTYGSLESLTTQGNTCQITYNRSNPQSAPYHELFTIAQNISVVNSCRRAIIIAQEGTNGSGHMISVDFANLPISLEEFRKKIEVNKVGN